MKAVLNNWKECTGCHACFNACSRQAIQMIFNQEGFLYPEIDEKKCVDCGCCQQVCPVIYGEKLKKGYEAAYGCYAADTGEQMKSSSGGVFALLAQKILQEKGIVYGAAYDKKLNVMHCAVHSQEELGKLRETKYVQSTIGFVYKEVQENLKKGKQVLFSGTPCQIVGLKTFLKKEYEKLICVDLVCHGVPAPLVWRDYLREKSDGEKSFVSASFRDKSRGMKDVYLTYTYPDGTVVQEKYAESRYIHGFLNGFYMRESCFQCQYNGFSRSSDLTVGDFWGVEDAHAGFANQFGTSIVLIHNSRGREWFDKIKPDLKYIKTNRYNALMWNQNIVKPVVRTDGKDVFYKHWPENTVAKSVELTAQQYTKAPEEKITLSKRIKRRILKWSKK